jgi:hypothetical protein
MATACLPPQPTPSKGSFLQRLRTFSTSKSSSSTSTQTSPTRRTPKSRPDAPTRRRTLFGPLPAITQSQAEDGYIPVHRDQRTAALRALGLEPAMTLSEMEKEMDEKYSKPLPEPVSRSSVNQSRGSKDSARVAGPGDLDDSGSEADRIREAWVARQSGVEPRESQDEQGVRAESQPKSQGEHSDSPAPEDTAQSTSLSTDFRFPPTQSRAKSLPLVPIITHPRVESQSAEVQTWSDRPLSGGSSLLSPSDSSCSDGPITPMLPTMQYDAARVRRPSKESGGGYVQHPEVIVEDMDDEHDTYPSDPEFGGLSKDLPRLQSHTTSAKGVSAPVTVQKRSSIFGRGSVSFSLPCLSEYELTIYRRNNQQRRHQTSHLASPALVIPLHLWAANSCCAPKASLSTPTFHQHRNRPFLSVRLQWRQRRVYRPLGQDPARRQRFSLPRCTTGRAWSSKRARLQMRRRDG